MINFFTRSLSTRGRGGSQLIRGKQIAERIESRLNPETVNADDINIYVKILRHNYINGSYLDIVDGTPCMAWLMEHPDMKPIACSTSSLKHIKKDLNREDVILIPQQHCNFERFKRDRTEVKVAGVIGRYDSVCEPFYEIREKLKGIGIDYIVQNKYHVDKEREGIISFYKKLDIQIIGKRKNSPMKNALKIINACSFGIPTIAFPEMGYEDMEGYYIPVSSIDDIIKEVEKLKQNGWNAERLIKKAEEYHIDNIIKLYKNLCMT
jgi:hypothetical protein